MSREPYSARKGDHVALRSKYRKTDWGFAVIDWQVLQLRKFNTRGVLGRYSVRWRQLRQG